MNARRYACMWVACLVLLPAGLLACAACGPGFTSWPTAWDALFNHNAGDLKHAIARDLRLPRAIACACSGMGLAVAGALMQGITRNPIAGPTLLGLGSGASLAQVLALAFAPALLAWGRAEVCIGGALAGAVSVALLASLSRGIVTPVKLTLIGVNVSLLLAALANSLILRHDLPHDLVTWFARGMQGIGWTEVARALPWFVLGLAAVRWIADDVTLLSLGETTALGLGQRTRVIRGLGMACTVALAGTAYSFLGPVAFVGVLVPHAARALAGADYRRVLPCSAILGSTLMVYAELTARLLEARLSYPLAPGLLTSLLGAPCFLVLVSRPQGAGRGSLA